LAAYLQHPGRRHFWLAAGAAGLAGFTDLRARRSPRRVWG
jgi:hypothetical protein